ncbi:MAG: 50S ribosomal protein L25/general stress protein Ctc [Bacteroidales bacterium]|nr:50S ribosomal protein L25/general stress protein Ctc [Bacteroidales bacterium]
MKTIELNAAPRADFGKKASKGIRKSGSIPCVMYGGKYGEDKALHFQIKEEDLRGLLYTPNVYLVNLSLKGKTYKAILKEVQFHPVKDTPLHLDFLEVFDDKPIVVELPVKLNGLAAGVRSGGKLSLDMRKLRVKGLYKDVPECLNIDVTSLELGKTIQVGGLHFDNLEMMNAKNAVVCAVKLTRAARGAADQAEAE